MRFKGGSLTILWRRYSANAASGWMRYDGEPNYEGLVMRRLKRGRKKVVLEYAGGRFNIDRSAVVDGIYPWRLSVGNSYVFIDRYRTADDAKRAAKTWLDRSGSVNFPHQCTTHDDCKASRQLAEACYADAMKRHGGERYSR